MGRIRHYECNQCSYIVKFIEGGTMAFSIKQMVCNSCKTVKDYATDVRKKSQLLPSDLIDINDNSICTDCGSNLQDWQKYSCPKCNHQMSEQDFWSSGEMTLID